MDVSTWISVISLLKKGYDWITGTSFDQRFDRFTGQVTSQLERVTAQLEKLQNGIYRVPVQEVYDTRYNDQQIIKNTREITAAVKPIWGFLHIPAG